MPHLTGTSFKDFKCTDDGNLKSFNVQICERVDSASARSFDRSRRLLEHRGTKGSLSSTSVALLSPVGLAKRRKGQKGQKGLGAAWAMGCHGAPMGSEAIVSNWDLLAAGRALMEKWWS